ncbi:MAG: glycosyltransferase family 4 protein [Eubacterium sp.]|nr:glycosyltransferase family 4 protein [Eubacterium sp.]
MRLKAYGKKHPGFWGCGHRQQSGRESEECRHKQDAEGKPGCVNQADTKKRVLLLASVASMIDQFNMRNIQILLHMGYEVHVACNFKKGNTCDARRIRILKQELRKMHVAYHQWDCPRSIYAVCSCVKAFVQLWRLTARYPFLWMHCQSPIGGVLSRLAAHGRGIKVIYTAHGFHFYKGAPFKNWLFYPVEKCLSYWTDVLVTVNKEDYWFAKRYLNAGKVCWIPGVGIDVQKFYRFEKKRQVFCRNYQIPQNALILLSVGELSRRKNHKDVLLALACLIDREFYYLICGQGKQEHKLYAQAQALGIANCVRMVGFQEDVAQFYEYADIFVFPSRQEGLPAALMEAMAAGKACIVSDIRGNRELIDLAGGMRFPPGSPHILAKELELLFGDQKRRQAYGRHNRQKIQNYDKHVVDARMKKIYAWME